MKEIPQELTAVKQFFEFENYQIQGDADLERLAIVGREITVRIKEVDDFRLSVTRPMKEGISIFESRCKAITDPLKDLKDKLVKKVTDHWESQRAIKLAEAEKKRKEDLELERQALLAAQQKAMMSDNTQDETQAVKETEIRERNITQMTTTPVEVRQSVKAGVATMAEVKEWKWKVVDETKIPREYLLVDEIKINKLARSKDVDKPTLKIDGVEFYQTSRPMFTR